MAMPNKVFGVLYADPPWKIGVWSEAGVHKAPDNYYPTEETESIIAMAPQIEAITAKDAVLFLWGTSTMIEDALNVMADWNGPTRTGGAAAPFRRRRKRVRGK